MPRIYRLLSDDDTSAFCHKVSEALSRGWELHGGPAYAFDAASIKQVRVTMQGAEKSR